ncbi:MAG: type II and III secretion system protein [Planctomycetes bacterium]|nr:type II and III secretion system protein [Planctomycetota bacterium]
MLVSSALLLFAACRSTPAEPESPASESHLTTDEIRRLIAEGALKPVDAVENDAAFRDPHPDEGPDAFAEAERKLLEQQAAKAGAPATGTQPAAPPTNTEPSPKDPAAAPKEAGAAAPVKVVSNEPQENPYLVFGKRILVYANGLIMKPFPLRIGTGKKMLDLLTNYGNFPLYKDGAQSLDQVRLELLADWDQEQFADLRQPVVDDSKTFKVADWLVATTGAERLKEVESFINVFAAGVPQIEIEAKIVEVTTTDTLDLGVKPIDTTTPIFGFPDHTFVQSLNYNLPNSASAANSLLALSAVQDGVTFNAILQMLQTYDNVSIISRPKIAVREGGTARIVNTNQLPSYSVSAVQANGQAAATLKYDEIGIKLYVVPRVVGTQTVALNIDIEASAQSGSAATFALGNGQVISNPILSRRAAQTVVYLEPGQAVILGGFVSERTVDTENKVPILGSIPLLGYFFKSTYKRKEQANVLFFIRPRILTGSDLNREF